MDISPHNFVSIETILADVLKVVDDSATKLNSKGWYTSQIQQALEELSFDTFFDKRNQVVAIPENLHVDMPKGAFNLSELYAFNGDKCTIENRANIWWKKGFINGESGNGYVARDHWDNKNDAFYRERTSNPNFLFYSIQNGTIMLSEGCRSFQNVMIVYNGIMADIGDVPIVPQFFRQAVKDWVTVKALEIKTSDVVGTNQYSHWANMLNRYENSLNRPYEGSWAKAEQRARQMNKKDRQDLKEYMTRFNY